MTATATMRTTAVAAKTTIDAATTAMKNSAMTAAKSSATMGIAMIAIKTAAMGSTKWMAVTIAAKTAKAIEMTGAPNSNLGQTSALGDPCALHPGMDDVRKSTRSGVGRKGKLPPRLTREWMMRERAPGPGLDRRANIRLGRPCALDLGSCMGALHTQQ